VACQAHLDAIEKANKDQVELGEMMFKAVRQEIAAAATSLARSPHALAIWAQTAAKLTREALGISEPAQRAVVAGDQEAPVRTEMVSIIASLPPGAILKAQELAIEVAKARARANVLAARQLPLPEGLGYDE
jgi:hypothetical protein